MVEEFKSGGQEEFSEICDVTKNELHAYAIVIKQSQDEALEKGPLDLLANDVDMSKVKDGSLWKVTLGKNSRGKVEWRTAEFIEDIDEGIEDEEI